MRDEPRYVEDYDSTRFERLFHEHQEVSEIFSMIGRVMTIEYHCVIH